MRNIAICKNGLLNLNSFSPLNNRVGHNIEFWSGPNRQQHTWIVLGVFFLLSGGILSFHVEGRDLKDKHTCSS